MLQLQKKQQLVLLIVAAVFLFGSGYQYARWHAVKNTENAVLIPAEEEKDKDNQNRVFVHVAGAVKNPGVYQLPGGARVKDALQKAELLPEADVTQVNLAQILKDEQKIQVYYQKTDSDEVTDTSSQLPINHASANASFININIATETELEQLPGIGPSLAARIVSYREEHGYFAVPEDLKNVSGIGDKKYEALKEQITVS